MIRRACEELRHLAKRGFSVRPSRAGRRRGVKAVAKAVGDGPARFFSVALTRFVGIRPMQFARQAGSEAG